MVIHSQERGTWFCCRNTSASNKLENYPHFVSMWLADLWLTLYW
jgi:hypothetical protein